MKVLYLILVATSYLIGAQMPLADNRADSQFFTECGVYRIRATFVPRPGERTLYFRSGYSDETEITMQAKKPELKRVLNRLPEGGNESFLEVEGSIKKPFKNHSGTLILSALKPLKTIELFENNREVQFIKKEPCQK